MFKSKGLAYYLIGSTIIITFSYLATQYKKSVETNDDSVMIKKYLLNDSPLAGRNRPKLWIHTKYDINSRNWKSFYSRNTTDLNQPYIHLTIKTIINHCGNDFDICLIDDETFSKLIPFWDVDLTTVAEPKKSSIRQLGLAQLIYHYGGMIVPNSFICTRNLINFYESFTANNTAFVCESINRTLNIKNQKRKLLYIPDNYFMGATKNSPIILELVNNLKNINVNTHFSNETDFIGTISDWIITAVDNNSINLVGGEIIGIKTNESKTVLLDNLMEEEFINFSDDLVGIYIPEDEILTRPKYQWFAYLPSEQILKSNMIVSKYLLAATVNSSSEYYKSSEIISTTTTSI